MKEALNSQKAPIPHPRYRVCCEDWEENWPRYNGTVLYVALMTKTDGHWLVNSDTNVISVVVK